MTKTAFRAGAVTDPERRPGQPRAAEKGRGAGGAGWRARPPGRRKHLRAESGRSHRVAELARRRPPPGRPPAAGRPRGRGFSPGQPRVSLSTSSQPRRDRGRADGWARPQPLPSAAAVAAGRRREAPTRSGETSLAGRWERREKGGRGGRARGRGAGIGEEPLVSCESRRSRRQQDELPGAPGQPRAP